MYCHDPVLWETWGYRLYHSPLTKGGVTFSSYPYSSSFTSINVSFSWAHIYKSRNTPKQKSSTFYLEQRAVYCFRPSQQEQLLTNQRDTSGMCKVPAESPSQRFATSYTQGLLQRAKQELRVRGIHHKPSVKRKSVARGKGGNLSLFSSHLFW